MGKNKKKNLNVTEKKLPLFLYTLLLTELFIVFILPMKFASISCLPEVAMLYPDTVFEWILISWSPALFPVVSGVLLLITALVLPPPEFHHKNAVVIVLIWAALAFSSFIGIINASCYDYAIYEIVHLFGIAAFLLSAFVLLDRYPDFKYLFVIAIIAGTLCSCFEGIYQLTAGFEETKRFAYQQEISSGIKFVTGNFQSRLYERRVFAGFSLCNSFAAHIILTLPLCIWGIWKFAGNVEPPRLSKAVFTPPVLILLLIMLYFTGSRAAVLSLFLVIFLLFIIMPMPKKLRIGIIAVIPLLVCAGLAAVYFGRGISSMSVRLDYSLAAIKMFLQHPFAGTGWGDFFHDYMRIKLTPTDEAPHDTHNMILTFASQVGFAGLLLSAAALLFPIWLGLKKTIARIREKDYLSLDTAIFAGWTAWALHSLSDINIQIPATVATALVMLMIMTVGDTRQQTSTEFKKIRLASWYILILSTLLVTLWQGGRLIKTEHAFSALNNLCDFRFKTKEEAVTITPEQVNSALKKCTDLSPYSPFPWATAADFMISHGLPFQAEAYYKEAVKRSPERPSFYYRLYLIQFNQGNFKDAGENLKKARERFPLNKKY